MIFYTSPGGTAFDYWFGDLGGEKTRVVENGFYVTGVLNYYGLTYYFLAFC